MRRVRRVIAGKSFFRNNQAKERIFAMTRMQFLLPAMTARPDHNADDYVHVVFIAGEQPIACRPSHPCHRSSLTARHVF